MRFGRKKNTEATEPVGRRRLQRESGTQPAAFSYYGRRDERAAGPRQQPHKEIKQAKARRAWYERIGAFLLLLIIVLCTVQLLRLSSSPRIISLNSSGQYFLHAPAVYQQSAQRLLAGSIWNTNKVTVNTEGVADRLQAEFPELSSVSVTLPLIGSRPIIYLAPVEPAFIVSEGTQSYVVGSNGRALLAANNLPSDSKLDLPVLTDQSGLAARLNQPVLSSSETSFIRVVVGQLKAHNIAIAGLTLPAGANEVDVQLTGQPYFVKFNMHASDAAQQAGTFLAVQHKLQAGHITPSKYIDVRVDGRAYYQ